MLKEKLTVIWNCVLVGFRSDLVDMYVIRKQNCGFPYKCFHLYVKLERRWEAVGAVHSHPGNNRT